MSKLMIVKHKPIYHDPICFKCGGECCKTYPGIISPRDFGLTTKMSKDEVRRIITSVLNQTLYCADLWDDEFDPSLKLLNKNRRRTFESRKPIQDAFFIRMATVKDSAFKVYPSWGGACVAWTQKGCRLALDRRPYGCRVVQPEGCFNRDVAKKYPKDVAVTDWLPYSDIIKECAYE